MENNIQRDLLELARKIRITSEHFNIDITNASSYEDMIKVIKEKNKSPILV